MTADARSGLPGPRELRVTRVSVDGDEFAIFSMPIASEATNASLTRAESSVAELAAKGFSNREIAEERGTPERTVANQLARIYEKLGVDSRKELMALCSGGKFAKR